MPKSQVRNFAKGTVSLGYNAAATSIVLTTGHGAKFPSVFPYYCVWWNVTDFPDPADDPNVEIVQVTARSTDTLTIARGQDGSSASTKNTASKTYRLLLVHCAALHNELYGNTQVICGRFLYVSATSCRLDPYNGNRILINGSIETIPSAGVTVSNGGLVSNTLYYAYVYMSSGTMTLEFSTTAPATDTTYGHRIKTGDGTRTLVGLVRANASSQFVDSLTQRFVASWVNPAARSLYRDMGNPSWTFTTNTELDSTRRLEWVQFAGPVALILGARMSNNTAGQRVLVTLSLDGAAPIGSGVGAHSATGGYESAGSGSVCTDATVGYHYGTVMGSVTANTGTLSDGKFSVLLPAQL